MSTLSPEEARRVYDRVGARQDGHRVYEDPATDLVLAYGGFEVATSVFELGCGTGRFARRLLDGHLPATARYRGVDLSPEMVRLAGARLEGFVPRAQVALTEGGVPATEPDGVYDRFVSNFVFDLLSEADMREAVHRAQRMLVPGGRLCLASLSRGCGLGSRFVARAVGWLHRLRPTWVGGCRPVELRPLVSEDDWRIVHLEQVVAFGVPSEVLVAERRRP